MIIQQELVKINLDISLRLEIIFFKSKEFKIE